MNNRGLIKQRALNKTLKYLKPITAFARNLFSNREKLSDKTNERAEKIEYFSLKDGDSLNQIDDGTPFKCLILISSKVSDEWQNSVSAWIVSSGCLYMIAWGIDCSSWDDSVDIANLEIFDFADIPDDKHVMTTWHTNETLEEVMQFTKLLAHHPTTPLKRLIVLDIGNFDRQEELQELFDKS